MTKTDFDYQDMTQTVIGLCLAAMPRVRKFQRNLRQSEVIVNGKNDFLTQADLYVNKKLIQNLQKKYPKIDFLTEETTPVDWIIRRDFSEFKHGRAFWVIDPLDGTANFVAGSANYSVSVALVVDRKVKLGVIALPATGEIYYTWENEASYLFKNGQKKVLQVSKKAPLDQIKMALEPCAKPRSRKHFLPPVIALTPHVATPISVACTTVNCCWLAKGELDALQSPGGPWDLAAASIIVKNAGGYAGELSGGTWEVLNGEGGLFTNNRATAEEIVKILGLKKGFCRARK